MKPNLRTGIAHDETAVPQGYHSIPGFLILIVCGTPSVQSYRFLPNLSVDAGYAFVVLQ